MNQKKHAISAGHELTLEAARNVLQAGGNAFDAAIAAYSCMFITEPCMASAGGNGFALMKAANKDIQFLDFFCQTPRNKNISQIEFYPVVVNFGNETEEFQIGLGSAAVPGAIAAIFKIHELYGSMPLRDLFSQAISMAKEGVILNNFQAYDLILLKDIFKQEQTGRDIFYNGEEVKKEGDKIFMPHFADFLEFLEKEGSKGFYHGEIANSICKDSKDRGGFLKREDFENYKVNFSDPFSIPYKGHFIHLPNGPSKGGAALALTLNNCTSEILSVAQAVKAAQDIMSNEKNIKPAIDKILPGNNFNLDLSSDSFSGTSHINILDKEGNAISLTSSIGEGSGYFIPGTDMQLNNMLGELFLLPNGAHSWKANTRLHSMMTPALVSNRENEIEFLAGSGGASRIPYAIAQVIYHFYENGLSLKDATEHGRYHFQNDHFQVELGVPWRGIDHKAILWDRKSLYFGGVHSISVRGNSLEAIGDDRRFGVAEVFE